MTKYKKCFDCDHFENRCYPKLGLQEEQVVSICNKYSCCTGPERTCLTHKKHDHWNYEPELYASFAGRTHTTGARSFSPPVPDTDVIGPRHHKTEEGTHYVMPSEWIQPSSVTLEWIE